MNRKYSAEDYMKIIDRLKNVREDMAFSSDFIVGFPGETEAQFDHLAGFLERERFDHVGIFTFSPEEGTAAATLPNAVQDEIAIARKDKLMTLQQPISAALNASWIGRTVDVLVEQHNPSTGEMIGRCARFAPEVDGEVLVQPGDNGLQVNPGTMVPVQITGADIYDLSGKIVSASHMVAAARSTS